MRTQIISAIKQNLEAQISHHRVNLEVLLTGSRTIPEHSDIVAEAEKYIAAIAECEDRLQVINQHFPLI